MFTKRALAPVLVVLISIALFGYPKPDSDLNGLRCELQFADGDSLGTSSWSHFHFLLLSDKDDLQVFKDTNMWGYFARSFTLRAESKQYEITRRERGWDKNYPEPVTINRGDVLVTNISLCDGSWRVSPALPAKSQYVQIAGRYSLHRENDPPKDSVMMPNDNLWHGAITSAPLELELTKGCILRLNSDNNK